MKIYWDSSTMGSGSLNKEIQQRGTVTRLQVEVPGWAIDSFMQHVPVGCCKTGLHATATGAQDLEQVLDFDSGGL